VNVRFGSKTDIHRERGKRLLFCTLMPQADLPFPARSRHSRVKVAGGC
jgi:hypothetical protein